MYLPTIIQQMRVTTVILNNNIPPLPPQPNRHPLQVFTAKRVKGKLYKLESLSYPYSACLQELPLCE